MGEEKMQAQGMLRTLKAKLESDCRELSRCELNHIEQGYLEPVLRKAKAYLTMPVNTIPGTEWHNTVGYSHLDITYVLNQLERLTD